MLAIRSALFNILFIGWTIFLLSTLWLLMPIPKQNFRKAVALWPHGSFPLMRYLLGLTFEQRGLENIPNEPVIYASKHQSAWDTMYFLWHHKDNAYVMKGELNRIPFWKWYMDKCQHVVVDRRGGTSAMREMISNTKSILADKRSVIIFPEGTRVAPGETRRYHPGIAALYSQTNATVIPVALNSGYFWGRRHFIKKPGVLTIQFLPPIPKNMERKAFMKELEIRIESATRKLENEVLIKHSTKS
ncbi:uncharacterized protein METZ01_LOCUS121936 [marine metagenome]|uniref:Phospholipid/glycerol acyltransferase domain-containing protein n=1 Tax=marine metagenome TaxID=408172 RepID=A0A381XX70_9ZZZZ